MPLTLTGNIQIGGNIVLGGDGKTGSFITTLSGYNNNMISIERLV
jgi:tetraacyldisaccharide-1-P 4'-kinase